MAALVAVNSVGIPYTQYSALKDLFQYTNGDSWVYVSLGTASRWNLTTAQTGWNNPCSTAQGGQNWKGITCSCDSAKACNVTTIKLDYFGLNGTLPTSLGDLTMLTYLTLSYSPKLTGSIPSSLCNLKKVQYLLLRSDTLSGTVPSCLHNMSSIIELRYNDNQITGSLPEFGYMPKLYKFSVRNNRLTGPFPASLASTCQKLYGIYIFNNEFNSTFPPEFGNCKYVRDILAGNCSVHGNISFASSMTYLTNLDVHGNKLSGSLPPLTNHSFLYQMALYDNYFSGSLPESYGSLRALKYLWLYNNSLSGSFPTITLATKLEQILIQHNYFTGSTDFLNISSYAPLKNVDISNNLFSGTLSLDTLWTRYSTLQSFAANTNCLQATLSNLVCEATSLENLILDGLHGGDSCPGRNVLGLSFLDDSTYYLSQPALDGEIPACLFNLSNIQRIHLSGNDYRAILPSNLVISSTLTDMVMSNNLLYGEIPPSLLAHKWDILDLSFNKLSGRLSTNITVTPNTTIYLEQNRLSGTIPTSLSTMSKISILDGNLFDCSLNSKDRILPVNDPVFENYSCSSNAIYTSLLTWSSCFIVLILAISLFKENHFGTGSFKRAFSTSLQVIQDTSDDIRASLSLTGLIFEPSIGLNGSESEAWVDMKANLLFFKTVMSKVRLLSLYTTAIFVVIYMPVFAGLSSAYASHMDKYMWTVSMAYLSGVTPATVLVVLTGFTLLAFVYSLKDLILNDKDQVSISNGYFRGVAVFILAVVTILTLNLVVIVTINVYFIRLQEIGTEAELVFADIAMAVFKTVWTNVIVRYFTHKLAYFHLSQLENKSLFDDTELTPVASSNEAVSAKRVGKFYDEQSYETGGKTVTLIDMVNFDFELFSKSSEEMKLVFFIRKLYTKFLLVVGLMNNLIIPLVVFLFASKSCLYNSIFQKNEIVSSYTYQYCCYCRLTTCTDIADGYKTISTAYLPQFTYSYHCSTSFLRAYSNVFVYKAIQVAFLIPLATIIFTGLSNGYKKYKSKSASHEKVVSLPVLSSLADFIFLERDSKATSRRERAKENLISDKTLKMCNIMSGLLSFGLVCPPIAVCLAGAVWSLSYVAEVNIGAHVRHLTDLKRLDLVDSFNDENVGYFILMYECTAMLVPVAIVFVAYFIFEIAGDEVGPVRAVPFLVVLFAISFAVYYMPLFHSALQSLGNSFVRKKVSDNGIESDRGFFIEDILSHNLEMRSETNIRMPSETE